ncbi:MAG: autotransporter-associated beta strand repeat-containing protein [Verrucomicrobiae bacterium]|nr:autotransporter-associated beta strand repeat-containing protein [Verrucomicrobiae bacterium]
MTSLWWAAGWTPGYPNGTDVTAYFWSSSDGATATNYVDAAITNGTIRFYTWDRRTIRVLSNGVNGRLYMQVSSGRAIIDNILEANRSNVIEAPITLLSPLTVSNRAWLRANSLQLVGPIDNGGFNILFAGDGNTLVGAPISGTGGITLNGSNGYGSVTLTAPSDYSGGTVVSNGALKIAAPTAIGTGALVLQEGASLDNVSAGALTLANTNAISWNGSWTYLGARNLHMGEGTVTLGTNTTVGVNANQLAVTNLTDGGMGYGFAKYGAGTLVLWGSNSYSGPTIISAGAVTNVTPFDLPFGSGSLLLTNSGLAAIRPASGSGALTLHGGTNAGSVLSYAGGNSLLLATGSASGLTLIFGSGDSNAEVLARVGRGTLQILDDGSATTATLGSSVRLIFNGQTPTNINGMIRPSLVRNPSVSSSYRPEFLSNDASAGLVTITYDAITLAASDNTKRLNLSNAGAAVGTNTLADNATASAYAARIGGGTVGALLVMSNNAAFNVGNAAQSSEAGLILSGGATSGFYQAPGTTNATINFGAAEGIVWAGSYGGVIGVGLRGSNGATFASSGGSISLLNATSAVAGPLSVNQGALVLGHGAAYLDATTVDIYSALRVLTNSLLSAASDVFLGQQGSLSLLGTQAVFSTAGRLLNTAQGAGAVTLSGGHLIADSYISTNTVGATTFNSGTLTVSNGIQIAFSGDPNLGAGASNAALTINILGGVSNFFTSTTGGLHLGGGLGYSTKTGFVFTANFLGGTTYLAGANSHIWIGEAGYRSSNAVVIAGANTLVQNTGSLTIGSSNSTYSTLVISNGGMLRDLSGSGSPIMIGMGGAASNATILVDQGTIFAPLTSIGFTASTTNNLLMVTNGGAIFTGGHVGIGGANSYGHRIIVTGPQSSISNAQSSGSIGIGSGAANSYGQLLVLDGAAYVMTNSAASFVIGSGAGSVSNTVRVSGAGSLLNAGAFLAIGSGGATSTNNALVVDQGGIVQVGAGGLSVGLGGGSIRFNQGTLRASTNSSALVSSSVAAWIGAGGLTVDDGGYSATVAGLLAEDPSSTGGGFTKIGGGTLILASNNTWTGGTIVSNGALQIGAGGAAGAILGGVLNNGLLVINRSDAWTMGGAIAGAGALRKIGAGTLILTNANSYSGGTTNIAGMIALGDNAALGSGALVLAGGGLRSADASARAIANALEISSNTLFGADGTGDLFLAGGLNLGGGRTLTVSNALTAISGLVTNGAITKAGPGTLLLGNAGLTNIGFSSGNAGTLIVTNGQLSVSSLSFASTASDTAALIVRGAGARLDITNNASLTSRMGGTGSQLAILDGAQMTMFHSGGDAGVGYQAGAGSLFLVSGPGSTASVAVSSFNLGNSGERARLVVSNKGTVLFNNLLQLGSSAGAGGSNSVLVADAGSLLTNSGNIYIGSRTSFNDLTVSNGGRVGIGGRISIGYQGAGWAASNTMTIAAGSLAAASSFYVGEAGSFNTLVVTNGATLVGPTVVGASVSSSNNFLLVSGAGTLAKVGTALNVGSNTYNYITTPRGRGHALINDGAILETAALIAGANGSGTISNDRGVYQFTTGTPTILPSTAGAITLTDGTISFIGVTNADVRGSLGGNPLTNILFAGNNTFRLNASSNWSANSQNYTFDTGISPSNYVALEMINGATAWKSAWMNIGAGGALRISNTTANISGTLTNAGAIRAINANVAYGGPVVVSGIYHSDPSTNTFTSNLTVTASGALQGSNGDLFVFQKDLLLGSTNRSQFDLSSAAMRFADANGGPTNHVLDLSGSGALDLGSNWLNIAQLATNFSLGRLELALGNRLQITGGVANAFYAGALDLGGLGTNALASVLDLDVNLYYDPTAIENAYLQGLIYDFDEWSGALVPLGIPIPEPASALAVGAGLAFLIVLRRRKARDGK